MKTIQSYLAANPAALTIKSAKRARTFKVIEKASFPALLVEICSWDSNGELTWKHTEQVLSYKFSDAQYLLPNGTVKQFEKLQSWLKKEFN